jgi:uncharacterized membrane protein
MMRSVDENSRDVTNEERVRRVEVLISTVLRVGVITGFVIIILGIITRFIQHPEIVRSTEEFAHLTADQALFPHTIASVVTGIMAGEGEAIIVLGLLLLILTPVVRVAISIATFVYQHDRTFVAVTSLVLFLLLLSFFLGKAGG